MLTHVVFLTLSSVVTLIFFIYGFNHYYLLGAARRYKSPALPPVLPADRPAVAIHLPVFNEKYVVRRLIAACACMADAYSIERVKIYVIDDSDDETSAILDKVVAEYRARCFQIEVLRRSSRQGFKAGALQLALQKTAAEFIAIFDADFIPSPDFLLLSIPYFLADKRLGIVQSRWTHLNRDYNLLTGAIAVGIDVHFLIDQAGRYAAGCLQNFNGSGGILRRKALYQAGGWQSDTLAEDLDVSYRIQLEGYRILYLRELHSPGEVPPTVPSFKKQQARWACGSLRTAKKLLPSLLASQDLGVKKRLEAFIHLTSYLVHPLMFLSFLLACLATFLGVNSFRVIDIITPVREVFEGQSLSVSTSNAPQYLTWGVIGVLILLCTIAAWIPPFVALRSQPLSLSRKISSFIVLFLLGCGISLSNTIEAVKALFTNRDWAFKRTPKYALQHNQEGWRDKRYQVSLDFVAILELVLVCLGAFAIGYAVWRSNFGVLLILVPFTAAYAFVSTLTLLQSQ